MIDFKVLLKALAREQVKFVVVGGAASVAHGSSRLTQDLDIVYERSQQNIQAVVRALKAFTPYLRGVPKGLPFIFDDRTLHAGLNFTLTTQVGDIDLLGEIVGAGTYQAMENHTIELHVFGTRTLCLDLETLIKAKRAAGRPKDLEVIAELELLRIGKKS